MTISQFHVFFGQTADFLVDLFLLKDKTAKFNLFLRFHIK